MDINFILNNFETLFDSEERIDKFNKLVLDLAVRGMLNTQDPKDEPASELLKKIKVEKDKLIKEKPLPVITEDEIPYQLPTDWEWVRLGDIVNYGSTGNTQYDDIKNDDTWVLDLEDIEKDTSKLLRKVRIKEKPFQSSKKIFQKNDVLYGKLRPYLDKVLVADEDGVCTTEIIPLRSYYGIYPYFLRYCLKRPDFLKYVDTVTYGVKMPRLGTDDGKRSLIPLCPLEEQKRIVAIIESLQQKSEALKIKLKEKSEKVVEFNTSTLHQLTESKTPEDYESNLRFVLDNFEHLYSDIRNIKELRQAILQLSVQGKLVEQNPDDEPASELLKKIKAEKDKLIKEKKIKKEKPLPAITENEIPYQLPKGWEWVRLGEVIETLTDYHANGSYKLLKKHVTLLGEKDYAIMLRTTNFHPKSQFNYKYITKDAYEFLSKSKVFPNDIIINKIGDPGANFLVPDLNYPVSLAMNLFLLRCNSKIVANTYCYHYLQAYNDYVRSFASGTSTQTITKDAIKGLRFPIPPLEEQKRIVEKVNQFMKLCDELEEKLNMATQCSDELMASALNGGGSSNKEVEEKQLTMSL